MIIYDKKEKISHIFSPYTNLSLSQGSYYKMIMKLHLHYIFYEIIILSICYLLDFKPDKSFYQIMNILISYVKFINCTNLSQFFSVASLYSFESNNLLDLYIIMLFLLSLHPFFLWKKRASDFKFNSIS